MPPDEVDVWKTFRGLVREQPGAIELKIAAETPLDIISQQPGQLNQQQQHQPGQGSQQQQIPPSLQEWLAVAAEDYCWLSAAAALKAIAKVWKQQGTTEQQRAAHQLVLGPWLQQLQPQKGTRQKQKQVVRSTGLSARLCGVALA